jgi:hypothetical protein
MAPIFKFNDVVGHIIDSKMKESKKDKKKKVSKKVENYSTP